MRFYLPSFFNVNEQFHGRMIFKLVKLGRHETNKLRLIVENPESSIHYLKNNFPWKSNYIDHNRQTRGDFFKKPTQYWFINCEHTNGHSYQKPIITKQVNKLSGHTGSLCDEERSMISPDYARNFICDLIIGKEQINSELDLFK